MYKLTQTNGFRKRYLSFLTCTTRLTPQENVFLIMFTVTRYMSTSSPASIIGHSNFIPITALVFRNINMHAYCRIKSFGTPLRLHDNLLCLQDRKSTRLN